MGKFKIGELLNTTKDNQDWIEWDGCDDYPEGVTGDTLVEVVLRDDTTIEACKSSEFRWNHSHNIADIVRYRVVDSINKCPEHTLAKTKSDGGSSNYYKLEINGNPAEVEDVIYAMVGGDFILGNILKACRRMYLDSKGEGKEGIDMQYDANKIIYFANSYVKRFGKTND